MQETAAGSPTVTDVLTLEEVDRDLYRSTLVFTDPFPLYGGQVAAQALLAAGRTVAPDRLPHSLHGYFLRSGDAARPTVFRVDRDRDGGSFSARRVVAVQGGEVVLSMSASFQAPTAGPDVQVAGAPVTQPPEDCPPLTLPRLFSMESRRPEQPYATAALPTRFWARTTVALPDDPLLHACALAYLSDIGTGLSALPEDEAAPGPTLDHALWFHRPARLDEWVLVDLVPATVSGGRGWYTGSLTTRDGVLAASLTQETLFRPGRNPFRPGR
ncbi:acyl-CoA thioesterase-2 [Geodermatophilus bullaregiensis]|uniref:acyl-CoA thioesterase n=1 Tax=Geodermatophilus bullaregiensis TaxID=1564160 RepID=UPI0027DAD9F1|nr:acyl-CoA thioesterase domain-containing protein [Geodermatophilus bullaregiensis]MBM7808834.1 acyl-CoA thioesterase-2 [Geodermatophilus bullaregiensis]